MTNRAAAVKCKRVSMANGKKRTMCWDKKGRLTSSTKKGSSGPKRTKSRSKR